MNSWHHFIITRFNVNIHPVEYEFRLSQSWLTERFELFNRFCFPSIQKQLCQNFTWLVLFDQATPLRFQRVIACYESYANFLPLYCSGFDSIIPDVIRKMQELQPDAAFYLSTRLDNDDALARHFVKVLQEIVTSLLQQPGKDFAPLYFNFPNGLQYANGAVHDFKDRTNAFVSLLEPSKDPHTVYWVDHPAIYKVARVAQIAAPPLFLQNVHGQNVYNYIRGPLVEDADPLRDFDLNL